MTTTDEPRPIPPEVAAIYAKLAEEPRCWGCREVLENDRRELGYCSKGCRKAARLMERAEEAREAKDFGEAARLLSLADTVSAGIRAERRAAG